MMRHIRVRHLLGLAALHLAGCSLVFDGSRHRGADADASEGDADVGDAAAQDPCAVSATARCGEPPDEACPPLQHTQLAHVFGSRSPLGQLRPTTVWEGGDDGLGPRLAFEALEYEGEEHGKSLLLFTERTSEGLRPKRLDIPLHDLTSPEEVPLTYTLMDAKHEVSSVTSLAVARESASEPIVGMVMSNSSTGELFRGHGNLVTLQSGLTRVTTEHEYLDEVGAAPGRYIVRTDEGAGVTRLEAGYNTFISGPPFPMIDVTSGVPGAQGLRFLIGGSADAAFFMLSDGAGSFWSANVSESEAPVLHERDQSGVAAWERGGDSHDYVLIYHADGNVYFQPFFCVGVCAELPATGNLSSISTRAPTGEVPSAVRMPSGRFATLVTERYEEGDILVLQFTDNDEGFNISLGRITLLDLRERGERVTDAKIRHVETSLATTLVVAAVVGDDLELGRRVVMTGVRGCEEP